MKYRAIEDRLGRIEQQLDDIQQQLSKNAPVTIEQHGPPYLLSVDHMLQQIEEARSQENLRRKRHKKGVIV